MRSQWYITAAAFSTEEETTLDNHLLIAMGLASIVRPGGVFLCGWRLSWIILRLSRSLVGGR